MNLSASWQIFDDDEKGNNRIARFCKRPNNIEEAEKEFKKVLTQIKKEAKKAGKIK